MTHHHDKCSSSYPMMNGYGGGVSGFGGCGSNGWGFGIRWIYALLILIVIVLQFGRRNRGILTREVSPCEEGTIAATETCDRDNQVIDSSILFIIVVFLLVICAGCFWGGGAAGGTGYGYGGYGAY